MISKRSVKHPDLNERIIRFINKGDHAHLLALTILFV